MLLTCERARHRISYITCLKYPIRIVVFDECLFSPIANANSFCEMFFLLVNFSVQGELDKVAPNGNRQVPCEASNKEAFFTRVESYSISFLHPSHDMTCYTAKVLCE